MFPDLNRQLSQDLVAVFRHDKPLYYRDGEHWQQFDAIKEPFDPDTMPGAGRKVRFERVGFQVTGEVWKAIDAAINFSGKRFFFELDEVNEKLRVYEIDKKEPFTEITADRHAIRINTVYIGDKPVDDLLKK